MRWEVILSDAGLNEREIKAVLVLSSKSNLKASELAKELETTRLDAYNSLEKLQLKRKWWKRLSHLPS